MMPMILGQINLAGWECPRNTACCSDNVSAKKKFLQAEMLRDNAGAFCKSRQTARTEKEAKKMKLNVVESRRE
jgi:hypothetical protein